tara:strand:- start:1657 stop:2088 length:432 start_codon:yes stop_codon:yes gene_type:complete
MTDFCIDNVLLLLENKLYIHSNNNILHIEVFEEFLTDDDNEKMHEVMDIFYEDCKKNNISFYLLYNFSQLSIANSTNIIYNMSIYQDHFDKHTTFLQKYMKRFCVLIQNYTLRESLNTIIDIYNPDKKPLIIEDIKDLSKHLS